MTTLSRRKALKFGGGYAMSALIAPIGSSEIGPNAIQPHHVFAMSIDRLITGQLSVTEEMQIIGENGMIGVHGSEGLYGMTDALNWRIRPDGSGYFGRNEDMRWDTGGNLTVNALNVVGQLEAASIRAERIQTGTLFASIGIGTGGKIWAGIEDGERTELRPEGLFGYDSSGTLQFYLLSSDGKAYAAGGALVLDSTGCILDHPATGSATRFRMTIGGSDAGSLYALAAGGEVVLESLPYTSSQAVRLKAYSQDSEEQCYILCSLTENLSGEIGLHGATQLGVGSFAAGTIECGGQRNYHGYFNLLATYGAGTVQVFGEIDDEGNQYVDFCYGPLVRFCSDYRSTVKASINAATGDITTESSTLVTNLNGDLLDGQHLTGVRTTEVYAEDADDFVLTAAAGTFEDDPEIDLAITASVTSTVRVRAEGIFISGTVRNSSTKFWLILDGTTTKPDIPMFIGVPEVNCRMHFSVLAVFTGVAAGSHTVELQATRQSAADAVTIKDRRIEAIVIPTA